MTLHPAHAMRLVPCEWGRIRYRQNHGIGLTNVHRNRRRRFQLNVTHIEHQRFQNAGMASQIRRGIQFSQAQSRRCQPFPRARRFDFRQHFAAQPQLHANATRDAHQQETDQQLDTDFCDHFRQVLRRQHLQPTGERRQMNEQKRLVAEHQQAVGNRLVGSLQQSVQLNVAQIIQKLFAVGLQVGEQGE
ncbi:hypothetical protein PS876_03810 [Pseudomonas fluorescens]|nr:hypothetical protein PS876_03810 [Pseudomonas fluorescens]